MQWKTSHAQVFLASPIYSSCFDFLSRCLGASVSPVLRCRVLLSRMSSAKQKARRPLLRRHSLADPRSSRPAVTIQHRDEGGRSFIKYLMNKPWRRRSISTPAIHRESMQEEPGRPPVQGAGLGEGPSVRVMASILQPQFYYKTVPVTMATTVDDIITSLVAKFAVAVEDKDPECFYLMETHDTDQGSYSRVLTNSDRVEDIQLRWGQEPGYFTLTRKPNMINIDPLFSSSPSLFSTTEETSLLSSAFPAFVEETSLLSSAFPAFVEESNSQLSSQSLSDNVTDSHQTVLLPQNHSTPHHITSLVSPFPYGASQELTRLESLTRSLPRLRHRNLGSFQNSNSFEDSVSPPLVSPSPLSPSSPVIVNSPTHQYVITGSSSLHHGNNHGCQGNGVEQFHFPSADPSSPTDVGNHGNTVFDRDGMSNGHHSYYGNDVTMDTSKHMDSSHVVGESLSLEEGGKEGEGGGKVEEVTPNTKRRRRLSELMQQSIEGGLGHIMSLVVSEGRNGSGATEEEEGEEDREATEEEEGEEDREGEKAGAHETGNQDDIAEEGRREMEQTSLSSALEREDYPTRPREDEETPSPVLEYPSPPAVNDTLEYPSGVSVTEDESDHQAASSVDHVTSEPAPPEVESRSQILEPNLTEDTCTSESSLHLPPQTITRSLSQFHSVSLSINPSVHIGASLSPSRKSNRLNRFHSEMNMLASFSSILDKNLGAMRTEPDSRQPAEPHSARHRSSSVLCTGTREKRENSAPLESQLESLVSPSRREKLVNEAARRVSLRRASLRRAQTFNLGDARSRTNIAEGRREDEGEMDLLSGARREKLLSQALAAVRKRRQRPGVAVPAESRGGESKLGGSSNLLKRETHSEWDVSQPRSAPAPDPPLGRGVRPNSASSLISSTSQREGSLPSNADITERGGYATTSHAHPPETSLIQSSRVSKSLSTLPPPSVSPGNSHEHQQEEENDDEILCTFSRRRPITVVVRRISGSSLPSSPPDCDRAADPASLLAGHTPSLTDHDDTSQEREAASPTETTA